MQQEWFQLWVTVPYLGRQWAAWISTDRLRAYAMAMFIQGCPGATYELLDANGNAIQAPQVPNFPWQIPGM